MSRKTAFHGSAAGRRRAQRSHLQNPQALSSERLHRPTPSRAQIKAKGKHHTPARIEDALPINFVAQDIFWQLEEYKRQIARATIVYQQEFSHHYAQPGPGSVTGPSMRQVCKKKKITAK